VPPEPDENDSQTDDTGDHTDEQEPELPDLDTRIASFLYSRTGADHDDVRVALQDPAIIRGTEGFAGELLTELDERDRQLAEEAARLEAERLKADDEALREHIQKERAEQRAQADRDARDAERRARLEAEVAAEEAAAGGGPPTPPEDEQLAIFEEARVTATDMSKPIEERAAAAERGIAAAASIESGEASSFRLDRDALAAAAEAKLKKIRGE